MNLKIKAPAEALPTLPTLVWFLSGVDSLVNVKDRPVTEGFPAGVAFVRLPFLMASGAGTPVMAIPTLFIERLLSDVKLLMAVSTQILSEAGGACMLMCFFPGVHCWKVLERWGRTEVLTTLRVTESLFHMNSVLSVEI